MIFVSFRIKNSIEGNAQDLKTHRFCIHFLQVCRTNSVLSGISTSRKRVDDNCSKGKKRSFRGSISTFETFRHFFLIRFFYVLALSWRGSRLSRVRRFQTTSQRQESSGYLEHLATTHLLFFLERRARQNRVTCTCATLRHFFYRQHQAPRFTWR